MGGALLRFLIKVLNLIFLILTLFQEKLKNRFLNFKEVLALKSNNEVLFQILLKFNNDRSIRLINLLYRKKLFSCFESAVVTYKLLKNENKEFVVGARKGTKLEFHAWIKIEEKIIFGDKQDLPQYKAILKI